MEYSAGPSWLHSQHISDLHDARTTTNDEWKEPSSTMSPGAGPSGAQQTMDLSDFALESITASSSSSSVNPPTPSYYFSPTHNNYFLSGEPVPSYNPAPVFRGWPSASQIPLSSYSSLNGATNVSQGAPVQIHQSSSAPPQMMIDPQLTVNSPPPNSQQHFSIPYLQSQPPPQRAHYSYQPPSHSATTTISPSYVHTTPAHYQQVQFQRQPSQHQSPPPPLQPQPQVTLAPYALHPLPASAPTTSATPSAPAVSTPVPTASFYSQPLPSGPTAEQLKDKFILGIRPLIQPTSFTGAGAVNKLTGLIEDYGVSKVDASTRTDILTKIRDNAANHYFRAWQENETAMEITKAWLKESADPDRSFTTTTMPILHILDRLPMTIQCLKTSLIAKELKPFKVSNSAAIQDMASNLTRKWRALLPQSQSKTPAAEGSTEDAKSKKRKAEETAASLKSVPAKKQAVAGSSSAKPAPNVKRELKPAVKEPTGAKSDSSFFSAKKPPTLPKFRKQQPTIKKEADPNVAQPSNHNPFEEILGLMKTRRDSPSTATPPPTGSTPVPTTAPSATTRQASAEGASTDLKKKKSVTWAPDSQLESIKLIERAVYDDDPADGMHTAHSVRDLDRSEGAALIAHLFDEQIDWSEPLLIEIPADIDVPQMGKDSVERVKQEEREQTALGALYLTPADLPDTPSEPDSQIPEEQVDLEVKMMLMGSDLDTILSGGAPAAMSLEPPPTAASVAELVGQLSSSGSTDVPMGNTAGQLPNLDPGLLAKLGPDLQQLVQQAQALQQNPLPIYPAGSQSVAQVPRGSGDADWNSSTTPYPDYDKGYDEAGRRWSGDEPWGERGGVRGGRGLNRGGRGRGRGDVHGFGRGHFGNNKRKPCTFYAQGRCKYGDQCDFSHELGAVTY